MNNTQDKAEKEAEVLSVITQQQQVACVLYCIASVYD
jgi:hypothetical protein